MASREVVRHAVSIAGRVLEAGVSGVLPARPVGGALVRITAGPSEFTVWLSRKAQAYGNAWKTLAGRPDQARTAGDGHFYFLDLPDGQYTLRASVPGAGTRYAEVEGQASVSRDEHGRPVLPPQVLTLPRTSVQGQVTCNGAPVSMAGVRVRGGEERTFADGAGQYALAGIETGSRTLLAAAQGCVPAERTVTLSTPGAVVTVDFALAAVP